MQPSFSSEISADFSAAGSGALGGAFVLPGGGSISSRARPESLDAAFDDGRAHRVAEWLDRLLGCDGLVRCARGVYVAAVGLVGVGASARSAPEPLALLWPAPFVYLLIAGGFPYTVLMLALLIGVASGKSVHADGQIIDLVALSLRAVPWGWSFCPGLARSSRVRQQLRADFAGGVGALTVDCAPGCAARFSIAFVDS